MLLKNIMALKKQHAGSMISSAAARSMAA